MKILLDIILSVAIVVAKKSLSNFKLHRKYMLIF